MKDVRPPPRLGTTSTRAKPGHHRRGNRQGVFLACGDAPAAVYDAADHKAPTGEVSANTVIAAALTAAIDSSIKHRTLEVSEGTLWTAGGLTLPAGARTLRIKGQGPETVVKLTPGASSQVFVQPATILDELVVEDLTLDGNCLDATPPTTGVFLNVSGRFVRKLTLRRVRVQNLIRGTTAFVVGNGVRLKIEDCEGWSPGKMWGSFLTASEGVQDVEVDGFDLRWMRGGLSFQGHEPSPRPAVSMRRTTQKAGHGLRIRNVNAEPWYFWSVPLRTNSGASVTHSDNGVPSLTASYVDDTSGIDFTTQGYTVGQTWVRVMTTLTTGTVVNTGAASGPTLMGKFQDTTKDFVALGAQRGDIIETSDGKMAIVWDIDKYPTATTSDTLRLEPWWSLTDRSPVAAPANGATYTLFKPLLGATTAIAATRLTVLRWKAIDGRPAGGTFNGNTLAKPSVNDRYDVLEIYNSYQLQVLWGVNDFLIDNFRARGGYADQIDVKGSGGILSNFDVGFGGDVGVTIYGEGHVCSNWHVFHQGSSPVAVACQGSLFTNMQFEGPNEWHNNNAVLAASETRLGLAYIAREGPGTIPNRWVNLQLDGKDGHASQAGISTVFEDGYDIFDGVTVTGINDASATHCGEVTVWGALTPGAGKVAHLPPVVRNLDRVDGTWPRIRLLNQATQGTGHPAPPLVEGVGAGGTPEGNVIADLGSLWRDRDGGKLYVKETIGEGTSRTATGGSTTTIVRAGAGYVVNEHQNKWVMMTGGTAGNIGVIRDILSNTATTLTTPAFPFAVANLDTYEILDLSLGWVVK